MTDKAPDRIANLRQAVADHQLTVEARTDKVLARTEAAIEALRDLKHTACWIAFGLVAAVYIIVKVL